METIIIFKNSVVFGVAEKIPSVKINELRFFAKKEVVSFTFYKEFCRITAKYTRKVKVPRKAYLNSDGLINWINEKIQKGWTK